MSELHRREPRELDNRVSHHVAAYGLELFRDDPEHLTAVMDAGLRLVAIKEHDSVPWNPLGAAMEEIGDGEYRLREAPERLPVTYRLQAIKPA